RIRPSHRTKRGGPPRRSTRSAERKLHGHEGDTVLLDARPLGGETEALVDRHRADRGVDGECAAGGDLAVVEGGIAYRRPEPGGNAEALPFRRDEEMEQVEDVAVVAQGRDADDAPADVRNVVAVLLAGHVARDRFGREAAQ